MKLIGMLDSPYVRRTAISLECLGIPFEHQAVSVFSTFEQFQKINPVVKAPSLILDDGTVLMDSNLIIQYAEALTEKSLMPSNIKDKATAFRILGLALAATDKAVQMIYEKKLRPTEMHYAPWLTRVEGQLLAACDGLEAELKSAPAFLQGNVFTLAKITVGVTWQFLQSMLPHVVISTNYPLLGKLSTEVEARKEFLKYPPDGPGVVVQN